MLDYLTKNLFHPVWRPNLRRTIQKDIEDLVAEKIIDSFMEPIHEISVAAKDEKIEMTAV